MARVFRSSLDARWPQISHCSNFNIYRRLNLLLQVPDLTLWYGPDTYMGSNLVDLFTTLSTLPDEDVRQLHPGECQPRLPSNMIF